MTLACFSVTTQLLTFGTATSGNEPLGTCFHLLYKQAERRGPQVKNFIFGSDMHLQHSCPSGS